MYLKLRLIWTNLGDLNFNVHNSEKRSRRTPAPLVLLALLQAFARDWLPLKIHPLLFQMVNRTGISSQIALSDLPLELTGSCSLDMAPYIPRVSRPTCLEGVLNFLSTLSPVLSSASILTVILFI